MSQKIEFQLPDIEQIKDIFAIHFLSKIPSGPIKKTLADFLRDKENELKSLYGDIFQKKGSGRDIKNICEAAKIRFMLRHIKDPKAMISIEDIQQAVDTIFPK